jgi:hypothetical protein
MKRAPFVLLAVLLLLTGPSACGDGEGPSGRPSRIGIHLQGGFDGDFVQVGIDGNQVYADTATTEHSTGYADGVLVDLPHGEHSIAVTVNDTVRADSTFMTDSLVVIGVQFTRTIPSIDLDYWREQPVYY